MLRLSKAAPPAPTKGPGPEDPVGPERAVGQLVYQTLRRVVKDVPVAVLETLDAGRIMAAVDWQDVGERLMEIAPPLQRVITTAAREEIPRSELAKAVAPLEVGTDIDFALIDRMAVEYANAHAGTLVMEISDKMRETIRQVTTSVVAGQLPRDGVVRLLRATLPLHSAWADTVSKVYSREYVTQIEAGANLTRASDRAARAADIRAQRLLQARSRNIARTEVMRAQNEGKFAGWSQRVAEGWMPVDSVKEWVEGRDPCKRCAPLVGIIVRWDEPFPNGQMMPPEHPSCRCTAALLPPDDEFLEIMARQQSAPLSNERPHVSMETAPEWAHRKLAREWRFYDGAQQTDAMWSYDLDGMKALRGAAENIAAGRAVDSGLDIERFIRKAGNDFYEDGIQTLGRAEVLQALELAARDMLARRPEALTGTVVRGMWVPADVKFAVGDEIPMNLTSWTSSLETARSYAEKSSSHAFEGGHGIIMEMTGGRGFTVKPNETWDEMLANGTARVTRVYEADGMTRVVVEYVG